MRRINLLPEDYLVRRRNRKQTSMLYVYFGVFLILLVGIWLFRQTKLHEQEDRRDQAAAKVQTLQAKVAQLQEFAALEQTVKTKQDVLAAAMVGDIQWSRQLTELSMIIPGDSWLTTFAGASGAAGAGGAVAGAPAGTVVVPGAATSAKLGTINFTVVTFDFPGVAKWITRLQEDKSLQNIWVPGATKGLISGRDVINYTSTADLSGAAASNRYQKAKQ